MPPSADQGGSTITRAARGVDRPVHDQRGPGAGASTLSVVADGSAPSTVRGCRRSARRDRRSVPVQRRPRVGDTRLAVSPTVPPSNVPCSRCSQGRGDLVARAERRRARARLGHRERTAARVPSIAPLSDSEKVRMPSVKVVLVWNCALVDEVANVRKVEAPGPLIVSPGPPWRRRSASRS